MKEMGAPRPSFDAETGRLALELGNALGVAEDESSLAAATHRACFRLAKAGSTALVLRRGAEWILHLCEGDEPPRRNRLEEPIPPDPVPGGSAVWSDPSGAPPALAKVAGAGHPAGFAALLEGDGDTPGVLAAWRKMPFSPDERSTLLLLSALVSKRLARLQETAAFRRKRTGIGDIPVLLAQEKERLDYVLRRIPVGILLCDGEGTIALANEPAAKALGLTDVELRENKVFGARSEGRALLGLIEKAKTEGTIISTPYEMAGRWFQVQVAPWPGGEQFLVVTQDVNEWFQMNRLKEDLISIISHEVKNPLTAIINSADLLLEGRTGAMTDVQTRLAKLVYENSRGIQNLLDDILRLNRMRRTSDAAEEVPLRPLLEEIRDSASDTIEGKALSWKEELKDAAVKGDRRMVNNLFTNLIGNAVKYVGIGGRVGIQVLLDREWVRVRIMDDGPGIPQAEREHLFTPFYRASNVKEKVSGTGLGLVIARNIADRLGGVLRLTSPMEDGDRSFLGCTGSRRRGAAFEVALPRSDEEP